MEYEIKNSKVNNGTFKGLSVRSKNNGDFNNLGNQHFFDRTNNTKTKRLDNSRISVYNAKEPNFLHPKQRTKPNEKLFKSQYINDSGKWTIKAVNDDFVDFDDYIKDIKNEFEVFPSYNNKPIKISKNNYFNNDYTIDNTKQSNEFAYYDTAKDKVSNKIESVSDIVKDRIDHSEWIFENLGAVVTMFSGIDGEMALAKAKRKAKEWGIETVWNNKADAYRHFLWNAKMTRNKNVGYYNSRNIANRHEYAYMLEEGWIAKDSEGFDYLRDNTIIKGKMNQENFMDLWNNQVGRELANNTYFDDLTEDELFDFAEKHNLLIMDANKAYDFLGIADYVTDNSNYTVDVEWNLATGNVTVKKDGKSVQLKIGI